MRHENEQRMSAVYHEQNDARSFHRKNAISFIEYRGTIMLIHVAHTFYSLASLDIAYPSFRNTVEWDEINVEDTTRSLRCHVRMT